MEFENQILTDATEAAHCTAAAAPVVPARCQAHENRYYRALPQTVTSAMVHEETALVVSSEDNLSAHHLDTLEQIIPTLKQTNSRDPDIPPRN